MKIPTLEESLSVDVGEDVGTSASVQKLRYQILNLWPFFRYVTLLPRASSPLAFSFVPARNRRDAIEDRRRSFVGSSSFDHPQDKFTRQDMHLRDNGLSIGSRVTNSRHVVKGSSKHDAIVKARGFVSRTKQKTEGKC